MPDWMAWAILLIAMFGAYQAAQAAGGVAELQEEVRRLRGEPPPDRPEGPP